MSNKYSNTKHQINTNEVANLHDHSAEKAVLGSLLIDTSQMKYLDLLPEDFFDENNQYIYKACLELAVDDTPINQITVAHRLQEAGKLEVSGGAAYLSHLISECPTALDCPHYAGIVKELSLRRQIKQAADANDLQSLDYLIKQSHRRSPLITPTDAANEMLELIDGDYKGLSWGWKHLDDATAMIQPATYTIVGARPSVGKSELMIQVARYHAKPSPDRQQKIVLFCTIEMAVKGIQQRIIAMETGIPIKRIILKQLSEDEMARIAELAGEVAGWTWYYLKGRMEVNNIYREAERMLSKQGLDMIMIDYLGLLEDCFNGKGNLSKANMVQNASKNIKAMAVELNVPVIVASQLNRDTENRNDPRPQMADLRDSGSIEQDADVVLFLYRDELYHPGTTLEQGILEIKPMKVRQLGNQPAVKLQWVKEKHEYIDTNL